jgi:hypothetical protein
MYYLITNALGNDWRGRAWGVGVTHTEENPNYYPSVYKSPLVAVYMYPAYEGKVDNPRLWVCEGSGQGREDDLRADLATVKVTSEFPVQWPTPEQRVTFGLLAALNLVTDPDFRSWAVAYLKGVDTSKESASVLEGKLMGRLAELDERQSSAFAAAAAVATGELEHSAFAAHRAYWDSYDLPTPLDLAQTAQIVSMLPPAEIAGIL